MANSVKTTLKVEWYRGTVLERPQQPTTYTVETTSEIINDSTQIVGTTHELLDAGDATDDCFAKIEHSHASAVVQIGVDNGGTFVPLFDIPAGGPPAIIPRVSALASTYLKSDTASTPVRVMLAKIVAPS